MSSLPVLLPEAAADVRSAYAWYERQSPGLGVDFLACLEATLALIAGHPAMYPVVYETYRRALVRRFPFAVFYEVEPSSAICTVYAVFHCSRNPAAWQRRLRH